MLGPGQTSLFTYGRFAQEAESLVAEIEAQGGHAKAISADLGTASGNELLAKQARSIVGDGLDVLVLNAGINQAAMAVDSLSVDSLSIDLY